MKKASLVGVSIVAAVVVLLLIVFTGIYIYSLRKTPVRAVAHPPSPLTAYGIRLDSMEVVYGSVAAGQNLSSLLTGHVPSATIEWMARETRDVYDVRRIRAGNRFARIVSRDSAAKTRYFIYEINPIDFVKYDLRDTPVASLEKKKVSRMIKTAGGTISSSLWNCFIENKLDVNLGLALSEVYAWTIDFYGLQKGDHFRVIYEEMFVDGKMVGIDRILAASFSSSGKDYMAYFFEQRGKGMYFDEFGQSLQRSFLKAPLKFSRISSRFSRSRMHPILRIARPHFGVDYAAPRGTPVVALGDGHVTKAGFQGGYGRFVSIRHNSVYSTTYAHLSGYGRGITAGSHVSQGQVIGYVGSSGLATGPHLDFRVYRNGTPVDPLKIESPPTEPVDSKDMDRFRQIVEKMNAELAK